MIFLLQEGPAGLVRAPSEVGGESAIVNAVLWLKLLVETTGAIVIGLGVIAAAYKFARSLVPPQFERYNEIRLTLARFLALALEFQLGADILSTATSALLGSDRQTRRDCRPARRSTISSRAR